MSDSAFRRLLLDTVATVIVQPPSTTSLIELLRITTPATLLASNDKQRQQSAATVRDASKRDKLFRTLQLRIHPDKHVGDTRVTELFQDVTLFYDKCVVEMEKEDSRQRYKNTSSSNSGLATDDDAPRRTQQHDNSTKNSGRYQHPTRMNNPRRPNNVKFASGTTHSDYENYNNDDDQQQANYYRHPWYKRDRRNHNRSNNRQNKQPSSHICISILSIMLFPPLGVCALKHSYEVSKAYNDGRYNDARDHSERAYSYAWLGCLCFIVIFGYIMLRNSNEHGGEGGWDWDKIKHDWGWDNGP